jgi:quercetin dioxygenase-like cupin family protein
VNTNVERMPQGIAHMPPGEGRSLWVLGELVIYKTTSEQTGGAYSLFEVETPPGSGPPPHVQHREDESFYVLEGEYEFLVEGRTLRVGAGSLLYVPKGNLHAHKNAGQDVGRLLVIQTPGGLYERFFEEAGKPVDSATRSLAFEDQADVARILALAARYGIEITKGENQ